MKITKIRSYWIAALSILATVNTCTQSIIMRACGKINRAWVDKALNKWVDRLLKLADVQWKVINPDAVAPQKGKATIIMCNHASLYDIPLSFKAFPQHSLRMLAKKELSTIPILGKGMVSSEFPFVDRRNRTQAFKDLALARELMESGIVIWVAPEGTRSEDGTLAAFKKGAFVMAIEAKATIIPIGIRGAFNILPARTQQFNLHQTAEIHIGKPIDASKYTQETKEDLISTVHEAMKKLVEG